VTRLRLLPGERLHRLAEIVFSRRVLDDVVIPALADLQYEKALVADAGFVRRALVLGRGYAAFWLALAHSLAAWPPPVRRPSLRRSSMGQDLKYAFRALGKHKAFAALAVLTLALGIGSATTIFSVIQNVLFDPFPGHDVDRVVAFQIHDTKESRPGGRSSFQLAEFLDYQEQIQSFEEVIAGSFESVLYATKDGTVHYAGGRLSTNNFSFFGIGAALGRTLGPDDARPDAPPVFMLTHQAWTHRFGGDPGILGRVFVLNGVPTTLVGVTPPRWAKLGAEIYLPVALDRADPQLAGRFFVLQARLKPGVTLQQAEAEIEVVARRVAKSYPKLYPEQWKVQVVSLVDQQIGPFRTTLYTLAAAVALLLLIACGNVANMLLTRATSREREMAIRASLGANRARLVRQLLVESLVLAVAGAAVGCLFAYFGLRALVAAIPVGLIPRQTVIQVNLPVLLFSLVAAAATAVLSGLVPALQTARGCLVEPLKDSGKGTAGGARGHRLSRVLVAAEVALSLVLLAGTGLLMRSFVNLQGQDLGFDPERVLDVRLALPRGAYESAAEKKRLFREVLDRIGALPGVVSASATTSFAPYWAVDSEVEIAGETHVETWRARVHLVSEGHRETLGLRLRRGRFLSLDEVEGARKVAVVNQALAARYFGEDDPIGRTIEISTLGTLPQSPVANPVFEIVGIVADSKNRGIQESALPEVIVPHTVTGSFQRGILVRTSGPPNALQSAVKGAIWQVDRGVAFGDVGSLTDWMRRFSYAEPRLVLVILAVFACVGLVLVALGVFSVVAYSVARQTHEIGIRMALGAERLDVLRMVLRSGLVPVGVGVVIGVAASLGLTRVLSSYLFGVTPHDPATLTAVIGVVLVAGFAACYFPARRAARVDPLVALRYE